MMLEMFSSVTWYLQVSKMGVTSILVGNGVNLGALRQGLSEFSRKPASSSRIE